MDRVKGATLSGAEIVVRCLQEEGVDYVFGYPGGAVLFIYDELFKQDKVRHVLVRHEQGAAHAADAYSRSSLKTGVLLYSVPTTMREVNTVRPSRTTLSWKSDRLTNT